MLRNTLIFIVLLRTVRCEVRSSLTFVIDDTGSMEDDISAVKHGANAIFDTVMNSNASQIEDFVLVTFNDPDTTYRITTKDRDEFKRALSAINVYGGGDCPEMALGGIKSALDHSRHGSLLYVFTDASSKDAEIYDDVKNLAQKKQIQVVFVLTGDCGGWQGNEEVYYQLAKDTSGEVFHLTKNEVRMILTYVESQINNRKEVLVIKHFPRGSHKFDYAVDSTMKEIVISVSGTDPKLVVTDPEGEEARTEDLVRTKSIAIVKVTEVKPGVYSAEVTSSSDTSVKVTAETKVHFQHGFSPFKPRSIEETVTRPIPEELSHLSIKLTTEGDEIIKLHTVQIIDMDGNVLIEEPLILLNESDNFYITNRFLPPRSTFRILIHGRDTTNNKEISRMSLTPVAPQLIDKSVPIKVPQVSFVGNGTVSADFGIPLELKCKISGYPVPKVEWDIKEGTDKLSLSSSKSKLSQVELPYDYMSILQIDKVVGNNTYSCIARNDYGEDRKEIKVKTIKKSYLNFLKKPEDETVELGSSAVFECKVDAYPAADIKWYHFNSGELKSNDVILLSECNTRFTIKTMLPKFRGLYTCVAKNEYSEVKSDFNVRINGTEVPVIDKDITNLYVLEGSSVNIPCKITKGKPKPDIKWYFKRARQLKNIPTSDGVVRINKFNSGYEGAYICSAHNGVGFDEHTVRLESAYPSSIFGPKSKNIIVKLGARVYLPCWADGAPEPDVQWLKDDHNLQLTSKYTTYLDDAISFIATINDTGVYTCKASNSYGTDSRSFNVTIFTPVTIKIPEDSVLALKIGDSRSLLCIADGFPKPNITWMHRGFDPKISTRIMGHDAVLNLQRIQVSQQGYYTCVASNIGSSVNFTYEVKVFAPPMIENVYPEKTFHAVIGDIALRVPCKASGNPTPEISWIKDGLDRVATGTEWYDQEEDGTLVIKNVDKLSAGSYVCTAVNSLGFDNETYEVDVEPYPRPGSPTKTILVEEGKSSELSCDIPYMKTDNVRWFKDGLLLATAPDYHIINAKVSDSGIYICRVSNFAKSRSGNIMVKVGGPPRFLYDEELVIDYEKNVAAIMDCSAEESPHLEVSWWHNGEKMPVNEMVYVIDNMMPNDKGKYSCIVKNEFGSIVREFSILPRECSINIQSEMTGNQPLMLSSRTLSHTPSFAWPVFESEEGNLIIPNGEHVRLQCPNVFETFRRSEIVARCEREGIFTVEGTPQKFSELKCRDESHPTIKRTGKKCIPSNAYSETVKVGYETTRDNFLEVYEICLDMARGSTIYSKHRIHNTMAGVDPINVTKQAIDISMLPVNFNYEEEMYNCSQQNSFTSYILGLPFHQEDGCCFRSRLLVNPKDVIPGLSQKATLIGLNMVPHWSSCNSQNWDQIERRIRNLARSTSDKLEVWTGVSQQHLQILDTKISLLNYKHPVPKYLWKVVQDPITKASLAIIQLNVPDLTLTDAYRNMFCRDICNEVTWMRSRHWRNVRRGYTFCCTVQDFERVFGYEGAFSASGKVLYDVSFVAERTLI